MRLSFISFHCFFTFLLSAQTKFIFERPAMGSPFTIALYTNDSIKASTIAAAALQKVDTLNNMLSDYIDSSEINKLSATSGSGKYVYVSAPLFDILYKAQQASILSKGAYDITVGPLVKLWRVARKNKRIPDKDSLQQALQICGYKYLHLDTITQSVMLDKKGMQLDVGGLGKGFVAQQILDYLKQNGLAVAMVNAGGKIVTGDAPPGKQGWLIGINKFGDKEAVQEKMLLLKNCAVATSGDIYQYVEMNGKRYSHIVDPKTGLGLIVRKNVTAIAKDGTDADWLATACSVLDEKSSLRLINKHHAALLISEERKGKIVSMSSASFKKYYFEK